MRHGFIKAAACSPKIQVGNPEYNGKAILKQIKEAAGKGAKLIVFPELCLTGYTCGDLFLQELLLQKSKMQLFTFVIIFGCLIYPARHVKQLLLRFVPSFQQVSHDE